MSRHSIVSEGSSTLIIERDPAWRFKTAQFHVLFDTEPASVLKYGPNGLHFTEHVVWNVINSHRRLMHTNAVTYGTGEMAVFGVCSGDELAEYIDSVYGALIELARGHVDRKMLTRYRIEQKRLSAETTASDEGTRLGGASSRMFVRNSDIIRSDYPIEYFWQILLAECTLRRIVVTCHCAVGERETAAFRAKAREFNAAWTGRHAGPTGPTGGRVAVGTGRKRTAETTEPTALIPIPKFYAPPLSWLRVGPSPPMADVSLDRIENPIEKMLLTLRYTESPGEYCIKIRMPSGRHGATAGSTMTSGRHGATAGSTMTSGHRGSTGRRGGAAGRRKSVAEDSFDPMLIMNYDLSQQYYASPILASTSAGVEIRSEWVDDLYGMQPEALVKKYWPSARKSLGIATS